MMRKFSYYLCLSIVAAKAALILITLVFSIFDVSIYSYIRPFYSFLFISLIPSMFTNVVPNLLIEMLGYMMIILVIRRLWFVHKRNGIPHSYFGIQKWFGIIGTLFYSLAILGLVLAVALKAGSGVPVGMLLIPAMVLIPWAFFITELLSFKKR